MKLTEREKAIYQVTWAGSFVNFLLVVFKFIAGILGHSHDSGCRTFII